jgi:hypothetical protein
MPWKWVEPSPGNYFWDMWDSVIAAYNAHGIRVLLSISDAPDWARRLGDDKSVEGLPEDPAKYADFVARVSDRYRDKVQALETLHYIYSSAPVMRDVGRRKANGC